MKKNNLQILIMICGYSIFYFLFTTIIYFISLPSNGGISLSLFGGGDDGIFYYDQATHLARDLPYIYTSIHTVVLGLIMKFLQTDSIYLLRFFNYLANLMLIWVSLLMLKKIIKYKPAYWISATLLILLMSFYPSLLLNTTMSLYRDIWIYVWFLWCVYLFCNIFIMKGKYPKALFLIFLGFSMLMLGGYRKYALLSFIIGSLVYIIIKLLGKQSIELKKYVLIPFLAFTVYYMFLKNVKLPIVGLSLAEALSYRQASLELGGSQMGISLDQSNVLVFYLNYLYSLVSNFIGPLPWQISGVATLILMLTEGIVLMFISYFLFKQRKLFSNLEKYLLIQSFIWFLLIAISNDNIGTASRLRIVGWLPLLIIFAKHYGEYLFIRRKKLEINKTNIKQM